MFFLFEVFRISPRPLVCAGTSGVTAFISKAYDMGTLVLFVCAVVLSLSQFSQASDSNNISLPKKVLLELNDVRFGARDDTFRAQIASSDGDDLPMRIWLESKQSKAQWACLVTNIQDHAPSGANIVLPAAVVVSGLQQGLSAMSTEGATDSNGCDVMLTESKDLHLLLVLELKAFSTLSATYEFDLAPLAMEKVDVLGAHIRDMQDVLPVALQEVENKLFHQLEKAIAPKAAVSISLSTTENTDLYNDLVWTKEHQKPQESYFKLSEDKKMIAVQRPGIYVVQARGSVDSDRSNTHLRLMVNDDYVWSSGAATYDGFGYNIHLTHTLVIAKNSNVHVYYGPCSGGYIFPGANLSILLLQEVSLEGSQTCSSPEGCKV
ncbi:Aste57867_15968 [Aphanomyces stellatus]|uniref:Aste57867_15968 protein n=1 Tax=Aphanomyces stellatus TaxID=120398 RepID=A0A485L7H7_9STRA|nr:hypothetical protein As57867_015912 [Aphanomyces stellatus]VFT92753.1 Aste57867_15968 [Aphanomyces stellatus]